MRPHDADVVVPVPPEYDRETCLRALQAAADQGRCRLRGPEDAWQARAGTWLALHPDHLPLDLRVIEAAHGGLEAHARVRAPRWMLPGAERAAEQRVRDLFGFETATGSVRPQFALRSFSVCVSLALAGLAGILVSWGFGLALIDATEGRPPDYFHVQRLSELPVETRFWAAWFFAFSMGYPLGVAAGTLCWLTERWAPARDYTLPALLAMAVWVGIMTFAPGTRVAAALTGVLLPALAWVAYTLPWSLRQERRA